MNHFLVLMYLLVFPFHKADDQPQYKGGSSALNSFLAQNLVYPEYSRQNCISGTIQVSFNLDKNGKTSNVKVYKGLGIDLDDEAVRIVKLTSGNWIVPAGHDPAASIVLPIKFNAEQTHCQTFDAAGVAMAIEAYKSREALVTAVTNYYSNKYLGKADTTKEQLIISLKKQLGFDDDYADQVMQQANKKFKQGDKEGACEDWLFVKNIGSSKADKMLSVNCH
ncbi:energy transducer TonB [Mucilaginibacter paludis]|uniref:TonB family protein n=1 Tax=Mucilaginibacter paludis DSM 18603 TaxID=714943 RepID=H1Y2R1_9SPHI|nr:energy transducer TonB [Mucilaginibacter paludis]EHQ28240.1 TonB family protein [Mucilaginibacter paludis DSM 18603]